MATQSQKVTAAQMKVGIVVTVAMVLLAATILQQSWGINFFQAIERFVTYLPDVGGLKPGAPVWLAGIEIGKVRSVRIVPPEVYAGNGAVFSQIERTKREIAGIGPTTPNAKGRLDDLQDRLRALKLELRFVEVTLDIRKQYVNRIATDSEVAIESRGLIGDSFIQISTGTTGTLPPRRGAEYVIQGVRTTGFREIMTGANDVIANFGVLSEQFKNIALKINPDKVGAGMTDTIQQVQTTLRQADTTFAEATLLVKDLRHGHGTVGRLVDDPALYDRLNASLDRFAKLADRIQEGTGTLARLINDAELYERTTATVRNADALIQRVGRGEGTLGRLSKDPALYDTSRKAIDKFASLADRIDRGEGTMGRLLKDESLYNNLNQSTAEITKLIYDLRQDPKKYLTIRFRIF